MSDLQIGLGLLGAAIVAGVLAYNWWVEKQYRRRNERSFGGHHPDVLLEGAAQPASSRSARGAAVRVEPRIEPRLDAQTPAGDAAPHVRINRVLPDGALDFIAEIHANTPISGTVVQTLQEDVADLGKAVNFAGRSGPAQAWEPVSSGEAQYVDLRCAIQLADRNGAIAMDVLTRFSDAVASAAHGFSAQVEIPELDVAMARAADLDQFCSEVDVQVGISVVARAGQVFAGSKIRALAEAAGMRLQADGGFQLNDEAENMIFRIENLDAEPFSAENIRTATTSGITLLIDVPRAREGMRLFDRMVDLSRSFADSLDGMLADDNRAVMHDAGLEKIRRQLQAIYRSMESRGIEAGGALALRLFH